MRQIKPHSQEVEPEARDTSPNRAAANGGLFRPMPGPPLAELPFEDAYRRVPMCAEEQARYDGRLEIWDRATQTALEVREASPRHERPAPLLSALAERIAQVRGKPIRCFGAMTLFLLDEDGDVERTMEADQTLYLHPERANPVSWSRMVVGENQYPDVVLEVDNTTDVRRHKLKLYEAWGFPELWVEVPETSPRPAKTHGLTIYLLDDGALREAPISRAFPGWAANEIHRAFNEARISDRTSAILERVGAAMGAREGTGPDDDPLLRSQRQAGLATGRREALSEARAAELKRRAAMVRAIMADRHLDVTANFPLEVPGFAEANVEDVATGAMRCANEADFAALLRHARP